MASRTLVSHTVQHTNKWQQDSKAQPSLQSNKSAALHMWGPNPEIMETYEVRIKIKHLFLSAVSIEPNTTIAKKIRGHKNEGFSCSTMEFETMAKHLKIKKNLPPKWWIMDRMCSKVGGEEFHHDQTAILLSSR